MRVRAAGPVILAEGHNHCGVRPFTRCRRGEHMDQSPRALVLPRHGDVRNGAAAVGRVLGIGRVHDKKVPDLVEAADIFGTQPPVP